MPFRHYILSLTSQISGGQWAVPCDTVVPMTFTFGYVTYKTSCIWCTDGSFRRQNYTVRPSDYIIGPAAGNPNICLSWPRALPPSADGIDWQIGKPKTPVSIQGYLTSTSGDAFLRTVYSIYRYKYTPCFFNIASLTHSQLRHQLKGTAYDRSLPSSKCN